MHIGKRLVAISVLLAVLLSLVSGCGKAPEAPNKDSNMTATEPQTTVGEASGESKLENLVTRAPGDKTTKEYTIMVYMVGSDLESNSQNGCATLDMEEMKASGLDINRVNLLVYTGGSRYWHNGVPSDRNVVFKMGANSLQAVAATQSPMNMGEASTLQDFLNYTYQNFPAKHYGLICWDHGGGPMGGYGVDEIFDDRLYMHEMEEAFAGSPVASRKLDFLGFDACLMATLEVAEMAESYADYLIASAEVEPGCGWDYSFLSALNKSSNTPAIAKEILKTYKESLDIYWNAPDYTLSCIDLSQMGNFRAAADRLYSKMANGVNSGSYSRIAQARNKTLRFAQMSGTAWDLVDMGHMAKNLKNTYYVEADALLKALPKLVTQQVTNMDHSTGLAVYYPYDNEYIYEVAGQYLYPDLTDSEGYERFIELFTDCWINGESAVKADEPGAEETEPAPTQPPAAAPEAPAAPQFSGASLQLTQEQLDNLSDVTYTVFRADTDASSGQRVYIPVLSQIPLEPDSTGAVNLPTDQKLVVLKTDEEAEGIIWPSQRIKDAGAKALYVSIDGYLTTGTDTAGSQRIAIGFTEGATDRMNILSITNLGISDVAGRSEPELSQWEYVANRYVTLFPTVNNAGVLTDHTAWDDSGDTYYQLLSYRDEFWLEQVSMTQLQEQFFVQIVVTDTQGNTYASDVTEYYNGATYTQHTQDGVVYRIYADHAEVADYNGAGGEVMIAKEVSGKKVTEIAPEAFYYNRDVTCVFFPEYLETIGERAFSNCRNLTSLVFMGSVKEIRSEAFARSGLLGAVLPAGVERIEAGAFSGTPMPAADIPASVTYLGSGVFADCKSMIGFTVGGDPNGKSACFKAVNGLLLTADGKELVQAPLGASARLTIPQGVEIIRSGAVRGSESLTDVSFPDSLKHIGSSAFYDTPNLESLTLPENLETIGHRAFGQFGVSINANSPISSVTIGPKVRWIGYDAFDAFPIANFIVHSLNEHYSAKTGHLLNKAGTVFLHATYNYKGKLEIPEGVNHLAFHSLNMCNQVTSLVLPDSVVSMDANIGLPDSMTSLSVGKGLACWDNISDVYYLEQVQISSQNPYFVMQDGCIYSKDMTVLYASPNKASTIAVADTVTTIEETAFAPANGYNETLEELHLPASASYLSGEMFLGCRALKNVQIHDNNPDYASVDGMIYTKNGVSLILCPQGKTGAVSVKEGTTTIWRYAFAGQQQGDRVVIPEGVVNIRKGNFTDYRKEALALQLPGTLENIYPDMFRSAESYSVTCPAGSAADTFARSRGVTVNN